VELVGPLDCFAPEKPGCYIGWNFLCQNNDFSLAHFFVVERMEHIPVDDVWLLCCRLLVPLSKTSHYFFTPRFPFEHSIVALCDDCSNQYSPL